MAIHLPARRILIMACLCLSAVTFAAQAATYSFTNEVYSYDTPTDSAASVSWHSNGNAPACTSYPQGDDDWANIVFPAGFSFTFGGVSYTGARAYSNGILAFGTDVSGYHRAYTPQPLPITRAFGGAPQGCPNAVPVNLMLSYWMDLVAGTANGLTGAAVKYEILGTSPARRFVITWDNVSTYSSNGGTRYNFQVALYESGAGINGNFRFRYMQGGANGAGQNDAGGNGARQNGAGQTGAGATAGVQLSTGDYTQVWSNQNYIDPATGASILWSSAAAGPSHIQIQHASGTGVTCTPSALVLLACADTLNPCTPYTGGVAGTITATGTPTVNWPGGNIFAIPAGSSSTTLNMQVTTPGNVLLNASSTPAETAPTTCNFGSPNCTFTTSSAGFLVSAPNYAAETVAALTIKAVQASNNALVCAPGITGTQTVNLKCAYSNPATGTLPLRVGGTALNAAKLAADACDSGGANVALTFDNTGTATPTLQYADVGNMSVTANFIGTAGTSTAGLSLTGGGNFIVAPHHFSVGSNAAATNKSGKPLNATITALNNSGAATPNFGKESPPETVALTHAKCQPSGAGASTGSLVSSVGAFAAGVTNNTTFTWSEVGNIDLIATLASANYLGSGLSATGNSGAGGIVCSGGAGTVGRFVPDHFITDVTQGCAAGSYTYSGQPYTVRITALNGLAMPTTTTNYDGSLATSPNFAKAVTLSDASGATVGTLSNTAIAAAAFASGAASVGTPIYTFINQATTRQTAPTTITIRAVDTDAVSSSGFSEGINTVYAGRVNLGNAYGSELVDLQIPATAQYWNGTSWVRNSADTCTGDITQGGRTSNAMALTLSPAATTCIWDAGSPGLSGAGCATAGSLAKKYKEGATPGVGFSGDFNAWLKTTGAAGVVVVVGAVPIWMQYNWTGAGVVAPAARATFGVYSGSNAVIYRGRKGR